MERAQKALKLTLMEPSPPAVTAGTKPVECQGVGFQIIIILKFFNYFCVINILQKKLLAQDDQLSIFSIIPEVKKEFFLDIYGISYAKKRSKKLRLITLDWDQVPKNLHISIGKELLQKHPEGTIFKLDARLVATKNGRKYLSAIRRKQIQPAIEFYVHNMQVRKK